MTITNGIVEYTTPRPWDAASARVTLTFMVEPEQNAENVIAEVGDMAKRRAIAMLQGTAPAVATPVVSGYKDPGPTTWAGPAAGAPVRNMADIMGGAASAANPTATAAPSAIATAQSEAPANVDLMVPPEPITDQRLMDEVTARNAALITAAGGDDTKRQLVPASIHRLIGEYVEAPPGPGRLSKMPLEKRQAFLDALRGLA